MKLLIPRSWPRQTRLGLIFGVCIIALGGLALVPRVPLGDHYHDFADKRTMLGIPNALDVLSNLPFFIVGVWGVFWLQGRPSRSTFLDDRERIPYLVFFIGVALTGIGSFWYHLAPSNARLPWDLLPMTCSFMSMVVAQFMERISARFGLIALTPLLLLGLTSVTYWYLTESQGHGDYKFYLFLQFFSPVVLALIVGLFPSRYSGLNYLAVAFSMYVTAKLCELFDRQIYSSLGFVSGHSLKHVIAAIACLWILLILQDRHVIENHVRVSRRHGNFREERTTLFR
jgi:hypothetical protein